MYVFQPGCFQCRQGVQWPPPADAAQLAMQQAAVAWFNQAMLNWQAQQAAVPSPPPTPLPAVPTTPHDTDRMALPSFPVQAPPPPTAPDATAAAPSVSFTSFGSPSFKKRIPESRTPDIQPDLSLQGLVEDTRHTAVQYDPQEAEDMVGFMPSSFAEFVPKDLPVVPTEGLVPTVVVQEGPGLGITGMTAADGFETTHLAPAVELPPEPTETEMVLDRGTYDELTAATKESPDALGDLELEGTAMDHAVLALRPRRANLAAAATLRHCTDCGTGSDLLLCPSCGARTRERTA